jgi:hypothetical protein
MRIAFALAIMVGLISQQAMPAFAGTTGSFSGQVVEAGTTTGVAGAKVSIASPSQIASATTDSSGHFVFLNLNPDTYTIAVQKDGFDPFSIPGVTIQADQTQSLTLPARRTLKQIGSVTARAATDTVRHGVSTDTYVVNASQAKAAAVLGGGASQDSSYSAIASVPGLTVPQGQSGYNQAVYIRGALADTTGFELDGIPVNRAFDNYAAHTASNLGQQQIQVYTGGGPASVSSSGVSGFINDVIKTGTYPGFTDGTLAIGNPYYHKALFETGGATTNRNFSYYVGVSGYDQSFRVADNFNGAGLVEYTQAQLEQGGGIGTGFSPIATPSFFGPATIGACDATGAAPAATQALTVNTNPGCYDTYNGLLINQTASISDREELVNLHVFFPHKNGLKDDLQFLASGSSLVSTFFGSQNDLGGQNQFQLANTGAPYDSVNNPVDYVDRKVFNAPFGTVATNLPISVYNQPGQPSGTGFDAPIPRAQQDSFTNQAGIFKAQFTHPLSQNAFVRVFGYTFFSSWQQEGAVNGYANTADVVSSGDVSPDYQLPTHTTGAELQFADQIGDKNLVQATYNFTSARLTRFNDTGYLSGSASPANLVSKDGSGQYHCYDKTTFAETPCYLTDSRITATQAAAGMAFPTPAAGTAAALAGAQWITTWDGDADGTFNTVKPSFNAVSLTDHYKPFDKLTVDFGAKFNSFGYSLSNTQTAANDYYTQQADKYTCYDPLTDIVYSAPLSPSNPPPAAPKFVNGPCPSAPVGGAMHQFVHPDGTVQDGIQSTQLTDVSPKSYEIEDISPRVSFAYDLSNDTVIRASGGRFTEPPITAAVQYNRLAGTAATKLLVPSFIPIGFFSPFHGIPEQSATNFDLSLENRIHGTDLAFKITPYYGTVQNWSQDQLIGQNFVTHIPVGTETNKGLEFSFTKGNFDRNGLAAQVAYTYVDSGVKFKKLQGIANSQIDNFNLAISAYNSLTKAGGGAPCYDNSGTGVADPTCGPTSILNPYYSKSPQALLDPNGSYTPTSTSYSSTGLSDPSNSGASVYPHTVVALINYKHDRFAITPTLQFQSGQKYGSPQTVYGIDPRVCTANSATSGIASAPSPLQADYTSCFGTTALTPSGALFVPEPSTGKFDSVGQYTQPNLLTMNVNVSYELSKGVKLNLLVANAYHDCFGGSSTPWSKAFPAGQTVCAYGVNGLYAGGGYYNGTGINDKAANGVAALPVLSQPFAPLSGAAPVNAYLSLDIKL